MIGLGIIGSRVANNLRHRGFYAFVWNRTPRPVPNFVGSPAEVAELCDIVQIFVSDDDALLQMVQRMTSKLTPRHIIMAHSTVAPDTMRAAAEIVERRGAKLLDVPFTGSKGAAEKGQLVYYVGGDEASLQEARPVLEASSKEIVLIGSIGQASAMKIATNILTAAAVQGAAEALALVVDAGLSPEKFQLAMQSNGSNSATLDMKLPKMLAADFEPQFSVKHMLKDMEIASRMARLAEVELGVSDAARRALAAEDREGRGDADYSSILRNYFPKGLPTPMAESDSDGKGNEHPTLAGLDEQGSAPENVQASEIPTALPEENAVSRGQLVEELPELSPEMPKADAISPIPADDAAGDPTAESPLDVESEVASPIPVSNVEDLPVSPEAKETREPAADTSQSGVDQTPAAVEGGSPSADKPDEVASVFRRFIRRGSDD